MLVVGSLLLCTCETRFHDPVVCCFQYKEEVRRHFNCSTLEGGDLEDQGSKGTVGSHWEKRVFGVRKTIFCKA